MNRRRPYLPTQIVFGAVFILSTSLLLLVTFSPFQTSAPPAAPTSTKIALPESTPGAGRTPIVRRTPTPSPTPVPGPKDSSYLITVILPIVTSIISALGFISTTVMAWRKEKRDEGVAQLELERQRIELEKVKLELEQQKKELERRNGA